jgi:phosphoribosylglycinamide formyltransferase 1
MQKKRIAIFASGNGSNAMNLIRFFKSSNEVEISFVLSNRPDAGVLDKAKKEDVRTFILGNQSFEEGIEVLELCRNFRIDVIVLAGFLRKIPRQLIEAYPNRIVNIHPALLPRFGGKGMYGDNVHRAVLEAGEKESGISIHFVNEHFDEGAGLAQFKCPVFESDTIDDLRARVQELEHEHYAQTIEQLIKTL